ncbi:MAG TPA: SAM-dependent chlorinase/fluorinase [Gemmatimonadales bacterium]|nr:SAM-dependent chlorinase/fluorinase [Gemmatimonadales bacterium]
MRIVTLLTDFGTADGYVGEMKGVICSVAPHATLLDIAHDLNAHDAEGARLVVARYWRRFPEGTVHLVVVDPGVGSGRRAIAVECDGWFLVGPDNGVLSPALLRPGVRVVELHTVPGASRTFHGRDIFAPAAAQLASGVPLSDLGREVDNPIVRRTPEAARDAEGNVVGEVIATDRFGNLITNLLVSPGAAASVRVAGYDVPLVRTYADVPRGSPLALVGSNGLIEIAVREASAAEALRVVRGERIVLCARR